MPARQQVQYLVIYDICEPRRLQRVHRFLKKSGLPVQYSVFLVIMTKQRLLSLLAGIESLIDDRDDDVRCYALPSRVECRVLGKQFFPQDVMLFSNGMSRLLL